MMNDLHEMKPEIYGVNEKYFPDIDKLKVGDTVDLVVKAKLMSKTERIEREDGVSGGCSGTLEISGISLAGTKRIGQLSVGEFNNAKSQAIRDNT